MTDLEMQVAELVKVGDGLREEIAKTETKLKELRADLKRNEDDIAERRHHIQYRKP